MKCPSCGSDRVFRSASGNARLRWLARLFVVSVRCHDCQRRFLANNFLGLGRRVRPIS